MTEAFPVPTEKGGERDETLCDSKGCPLQPGLPASVPGMTLNCLNQINQYLIADELDCI
jgi:hypothetical protein